MEGSSPKRVPVPPNALKDVYCEAYLLVMWIGHEHFVHDVWHDLGHLVYASSIRAEWGSTAFQTLLGLTSSYYPLPGYGIDYVEHAEFMRIWGPADLSE